MASVPTPASPHPEVLFASVTLATTSPALATPTLCSVWILTSATCSVPAPSTAPTPRGLINVPVLLDIWKKAAIAGQGENHLNCCTQFTATLMV